MNLKGVKPGVWVRTIVLVVGLINLVLTELGLNPLGVSESELYSIASLAVTVIGSVWAGWKNNSFTAAAQKADEVMASLKSGAEEE